MKQEPNDTGGNHTSKHSIFWSIIFYLVWFRSARPSVTSGLILSPFPSLLSLMLRSLRYGG